MAAAVALSASLAAVPGVVLAEDGTASTSADAGTGTELSGLRLLSFRHLLLPVCSCCRHVWVLEATSSSVCLL